MKPGIYDITNDEYHSSAGVSRSQLSVLKNSPYNYWYQFINPESPKQEEKDAWIFGRLLNTMLIEPQNFDNDFIVSEKYDRRTKEGKEKHEEYLKKASGKKVISHDSYVMATEMIEEARNHQRISSILSGAIFEQSIYWIDKETGLLVKTRPDIWNLEINILVDIKTSKETNPKDFMRTVDQYDYHMQAAMQIDGIYENTHKSIELFINLVFPKEKPYLPFLVPYDNSVIEKGRELYKSGLKLLKACQEKNNWDEERKILLSYELPSYHANRNPFNEHLEIYGDRPTDNGNL